MITGLNLFYSNICLFISWIKSCCKVFMNMFWNYRIVNFIVFFGSDVVYLSLEKLKKLCCILKLRNKFKMNDNDLRRGNRYLIGFSVSFEFLYSKVFRKLNFIYETTMENCDVNSINLM